MRKTLRIAALMLAALALFSGLGALAAEEYGAWTIELKDIAITAEGERIEVDPVLVLRAGWTDNREKAWLTAEIESDGEALAGFWAEEEESGVSRYAYSAGDTCGVMDGKGGARFHRIAMLQMGVEPGEIPEEISGALEMLDAFLKMPKGVGYLFGQLGSAKELGDNRYAVMVELPGGSVEGTLSWQWERRAKKPFDLNGRREAAYGTSDGIAGTEGFGEAREALEERLAEDESLEEAMIALMILFGE